MKPILRIGCIHRIRHFPYWATLAQGIASRAAELEIVMCQPLEDADDDWTTAVEDVLHQRPNVVLLPHSVVQAFPESVGPFVSAGVPLVGVEMAPHEHMVCVVRADEQQGAEAIVSYMFDSLGGMGKVANIGAGGRTPRQEAFERALEAFPDIELAAEETGDWNRESGLRAMRAVLDRNPDLQGVFAHNDHMALGACDAIAERGLQDAITVVGFDADPQGLIAIQEGRLAATIYRGLYRVGRTAVDVAASVAHQEAVEPEVRVPTTLITRENLVTATLDTTVMLPELLHDLTESNRQRRQLQEETIAAQRVLIQELSTPILPVSDDILVLPLVGSFDTARAQQLVDVMLAATAQRSARYLIVDITGIPVVDTAVAHHLIQAAQAVQLLGAQVILVGISPDVAQTLVSLAVNFRSITTLATLQAGLQYAQQGLDRRSA